MTVEDRYQTLPFDEAIDYLRDKISLPSDRWDDITDDEHDAAFIVAGAKGSLLSDLRSAVDRAISEGRTLEEFSKDFDRISEGWTHRGGKDWRAKIIYGTNLRMTYAAGRYQQQLDPDVLKIQPFLQYIHGDSDSPRPTHLALNGQVFRANEMPFYPPNGFGCSCRSISLTRRQLEQQGLEVSDIKRGDRVPVEIDGRLYNPVIEPAKGFDYIPGRSSEERRWQVLETIIERSPESIAEFMREEAERIDLRFEASQSGGGQGSGGGNQQSSSSPAQRRSFVPDGTPVSAALALDPRVAKLKPLIDLIDQVHGDGKLPRLPIRELVSGNSTIGGVYQWYGAGVPYQIAIRPNAGARSEFSLAHEIGHFLDHQGIGKPGNYASKVGDPLMQGWRNAVDQSPTIQTIQVVIAKGSYASQGGRIALTQVELDHLKYLTRPEEIWARSYAQWLVTVGGRFDRPLKVIQGRKNLGRFNQWQDKEFEPILEEIDKLFIGLGWLK